MSEYHIPVLLKESIEALNIRNNRIYVDATLGGGGHTIEILKTDPTIKLFSFDQDKDSIIETESLLDKFPDSLTIIKDNFINLQTRLALERIKKIDGILFDLGVSSHQFNLGERGFSFSYDADLDMRMDRSSEMTAADVVNNFEFDKLIKIFFEYGEERESARIANAIIKYRENKEINSTNQLAEIVENAIHSRKQIKAKARIFQALRIYVNRELDVLKSAISDAIKILNPFGRIVVISYHSLEDRIVKNIFKYEEKNCICHPDLLLCCCNKKSTLKIITKKPIIPDQAEIENNSRARSAKLRIAEKKEES